MRWLVVVLTVVVAVSLAACGSSSSSNPQNPTPLGGTISGSSFTPADTGAIVVGTGSTPCEFLVDPGTMTSVIVAFKAVVLEATEPGSADTVCGDLATLKCPSALVARSATVLVGKVSVYYLFAGGSRPASWPEPALGSASYGVSPQIADVILPAGSAWAETLTVGADPSAISTSVGQSGSVTLDPLPATTASPVKGSLSIAFDHGNSLSGSFSASQCANTINACAVAGALLQSVGGGTAAICSVH